MKKLLAALVVVCATSIVLGAWQFPIPGKSAGGSTVPVADATFEPGNWYSDAGCTTLATTDGTAINCFYDPVSGCKAPLASATAATYKTNIVNGHPVARFNGVTSYGFSNCLNLFQNIAGVSIYNVVNRSSGSGVRRTFYALSNDGSHARYLYQFNAAGTLLTSELANSDGTTPLAFAVSGGFAFGQWELESTSFDLIAQTGVTRYNNTSEGTVSGYGTGTNSPNTASSTICIGNNCAGGNNFFGDMLSVRIYKRAVSAGDNTLIKSYLCTLAGLTCS